MKFDELYEELMGSPNSMDDYVEMVKSMPGDQLMGVFREDLHAYFGGIKGTAGEDDAQARIEIIGNELLKKGFMPEDISTVYRQVEAEEREKSQQADEYEHKGWPGDGSGEDDFADYNQMEGNDY